MGRKRILVADGSMTIRTLICTFLAAKNFEVCEAVDGRDAVEKAKTLKPDLILLDFGMSHLDDGEAVSILKDTRPNVPIIQFTMHDSNIGERPGLATGVHLVLSRPDAMKKLVESIQHSLGLGSENPIKTRSASH
jgi:two-component system OmpR family response regulator